MTAPRPDPSPAPRPRRRHLLDAVVAIWVLLWFGIGSWVGYDVYGLASLSDSVAHAGHALDNTGQAIQQLGNIPLIGSAPKNLGDQVRHLAQEVTSRSAGSGRQLRELGVLLGIAIGFIPFTVVLAVYLPFRLGRVRYLAARPAPTDTPRPPPYISPES